MREVILGHRGMVGSAIHRLLPNAGIIPGSWNGKPGGMRMDLRHDNASSWFLRADVLYLCAARVGGIQRNISEPGSMIYDNLMIQANVIEAARLAGVKLIVFLGSSCIYPRAGVETGRANSEPLREEHLLTGELEPTNEPYAIAKIAGIKMLEAYKRQHGMEYLAVMPCNLYGPGDNFDPESSHFIPGMIRRFHEAKLANAPSVTLWGSGTPRREIMHVDDCARIIVELVRVGARGLVNVGPGVDHELKFYADLFSSVTGFAGAIEWDTSKPEGVMRKLMDVTRMRGYGIEPKIHSMIGIRMTYDWFLENKA